MARIGMLMANILVYRAYTKKRYNEKSRNKVISLSPYYQD